MSNIIKNKYKIPEVIIRIQEKKEEKEEEQQQQ